MIKRENKPFDVEINKAEFVKKEGERRIERSGDGEKRDRERTRAYIDARTRPHVHARARERTSASGENTGRK